MNKGIFCISIDTELLWGRKDLDYSNFIERTKKEREIIKKLLDLFKRYNIPSTWAMVGKLYENGNDLWSGKDIISWIKKDRNQEIASHSYSHEDISTLSAEAAKKEFSFPKGKSFIFPRNHIKYLNLLYKNGFRVYRGADETNTATHIVQLINLLFGIAPKTYKPISKNGLTNIPGSMYFVSNRGLRKYIPLGFRQRRAKLGIDQAIQKGEIFHLWFHPVDFADNTRPLLKEFEKILIYADQKRKTRELQIKNMDQTVREFSLSKTI